MWEIAEHTGYRLMPQDIIDDWTIHEIKEYLGYRKIKNSSKKQIKKLLR